MPLASKRPAAFPHPRRVDLGFEIRGFSRGTPATTTRATRAMDQQEIPIFAHSSGAVPDRPRPPCAAPLYRYTVAGFGCFQGPR